MNEILGAALPLIVMLGLFYLIVFLPENKRKKKYNAMLEALKVNDEVLTRGGIIGKITSIQDDHVLVQTGPDRARLKISKNGIASVITESKTE
ncbi:preprotein translocase subunit YajC [Clostridium thermarum]|uniref:preprotein translocase subunit YajC n=1 Tax=Clostridium thermarum TaxID=1716543 RepID=UPI00111ED1CC|nr:preprotein translocase subunit YajC [Clostridium thermarum]